MMSFGRTCVVGGILALVLGGCHPGPKPAQGEAAKPPHTPTRVDSAVPSTITAAWVLALRAVPRSCWSRSRSGVIVEEN